MKNSNDYNYNIRHFCNLFYPCSLNYVIVMDESVFSVTKRIVINQQNLFRVDLKLWPYIYFVRFYILILTL